jgi:hypothetical protein
VIQAYISVGLREVSKDGYDYIATRYYLILLLMIYMLQTDSQL